MSFLKKPIFLPLFFLLLFAIIALLVPVSGFPGDQWYWYEWGRHMYEHGFASIYGFDDIDYNPLFLYFLYVFSANQDSFELILENINQLKYVVLIFDFIAPIAGVYLLFNDWKKRLVYPLLFLLSIPYFYNTLFWGQVDAFYTALVFFSLLFVYKNKPILGISFLVLAYLAKMQTIVFIPIFLLGLLPQVRKKPINALGGVLIGAVIAVLVVLPFAMEGGLQKIIDINFNAVGRYPYVSLSAYNFWYIVLPINQNFWLFTDDTLFMGLAYRKWGFVLFFLTSFIALFPLIVTSIKHTLKGVLNNPTIFKQLFLISGLIALLFFFFNTQMHERYSHPALLFLGIYALLAKDYWPYILVSLAYVLNLEKVLRFLLTVNIDPKYGKFYFDERFIASLYLIAIGWCMYKVYRNFDFKTLALKET